MFHGVTEPSVADNQNPQLQNLSIYVVASPLLFLVTCLAMTVQQTNRVLYLKTSFILFWCCADSRQLICLPPLYIEPRVLPALFWCVHFLVLRWFSVVDLFISFIYCATCIACFVLVCSFAGVALIPGSWFVYLLYILCHMCCLLYLGAFICWCSADSLLLCEWFFT